MKVETHFSYDAEDDILLLHKGNEKSKGSVEIGNFIIDFTADMKKAVGLEILDASKILGNLNHCLNRDSISNIKHASLRTENTGEAIYVYYCLIFALDQKDVELSSMVPLAQPIKAF